MKDLSVEEKVIVKSKNLDVLAEYKRSKRKKSANFVVIGRSIILSLVLNGSPNLTKLKVMLMLERAL